MFCSGCGARLDAVPPVTCRHCGIPHWRNPKPCAGALVTHEGCLLLVRRAKDPWKGYWDVPGGFCEPHEHPMLTAEREVEEESGVRIRVTGILGVWLDEYHEHEAREQPKLTLNVYYHAIPDGPANHRRDDGETLAARWFRLDDLPEDLAFPGHSKALLEAWRQAVANEDTVSPLRDRPR